MAGDVRVTVRVPLMAADWGPAIGLGHLQRSLALAHALQREGAAPHVVSPARGLFRERVEATGLAVAAAADWPDWSEGGIVALQGLARVHGSDAIIVDSYRVAPAQLERLRASGVCLIAIDDLAPAPSPCHVVINGGAAARELPYRSVHGDTRFLLGPEYALLRPAFWSRAERKRRESVDTLLVTVGGADPTSVTRRLLEALDALAADLSIEVLVGPLSDPAPLGALTAACRHAVRLHRDPPNLHDLLLEADLAVSAAGQTLSELAWAGCPTVAFALADNQWSNLRALAALGVVRSAGSADAPGFPGSVRAAVDALLADRAARQAMSEVGRRTIDGRGALRVARELCDL